MLLQPDGWLVLLEQLGVHGQTSGSTSGDDACEAYTVPVRRV